MLHGLDDICRKMGRRRGTRLADRCLGETCQAEEMAVPRPPRQEHARVLSGQPAGVAKDEDERDGDGGFWGGPALIVGVQAVTPPHTLVYLFI